MNSIIELLKQATAPSQPAEIQESAWRYIQSLEEQNKELREMIAQLLRSK